MWNFAAPATALCIGLFATPSAGEKAAPAPSYTLTLSGDNVIEVLLNGSTQRLLIDPDGPGTRVVNVSVAKALGLKPGLIGFAHRIGPITIRAGSDGVNTSYGFVTKKDRVIWFDRETTRGADGIAGPSALPYRLVQFTLAPPQAGEKTTVLPMEAMGSFGVSGVGTKMKFGKEELIVRFTLARDAPLATAPTGQFLASTFGGTLSGPTAELPIRFGVSRPTRQLTLSKPFTVAGRGVAAIAVRVSDFGDASNIADAATPNARVDPDEIIVTASKKKKKQKQELVLGRQFLAGCSSLTYDFQAKQIRLSCI